MGLVGSEYRLNVDVQVFMNSFTGDDSSTIILCINTALQLLNFYNYI